MRKLTFLLAWLALAIPCSAKIIYVDADAAGANDGTSWADAYSYLQDALFNASSGAEIQVAEGIYKPHLNSYSLAPVSRSDTFRLKNGVTIKGGYAGFGEPDPDARDIGSYVSVLSGDMNGNDADVGSPEDLLNEPTRADNNYHVVTAIGVDVSAVLDGFTIMGGQANGGTNEDTYGGGIYNYDASPTVKDCKFGANSSVRGGAIYISGDFSGTLTDCLFENNAAAKYGGAISYIGFGELNIIRCEFRDGYADRGGVIYNGYASLIFSQCILVGNQAEYAGAISTGGDITLTNCLLANNQALVWGGALSNMENTSRSINCTFVGNSANYGGAIFSNIECDTIAINSIFWNNTAQNGSQIATSGSHGGSTLTVNYCDIENLLDGLYVPDGCTLNWGEDNINAEPLFADSDNGDYRLSASSPCVDAGDNESVPPNICDLDGNPRIVNGTVDIGAYEFRGPRVIYVDGDATGNNDGTSWADAYNYLQDALMMASAGGEIRVAEGTYKPDQFVLSARPNLGRMETFQLKNGVTIKGGYTGFGEPDPDARDIRDYETVLSGDIGIAGDNSDNSYHVVTSSGSDETGVLDGLTITAGQADGSFPHNHGGGIHNFGGSPTVINCWLYRNYASGGGGGVSSEGEPAFTNCVFRLNATGGSGGGLYNWNGHTTLIDCHFSSNSAGWGGGGLATQTAATTVTDCSFGGNSSSGGNGGAMSYDGGQYTVTNCEFYHNLAERGGAIWSIDCGNSPEKTAMLKDCRFHDNDATNGGGMFNSFSSPTVTNCTFSSDMALSFGGGVYNEDNSNAVFVSCTFENNRADERGGGMSNHQSGPELTNCMFKGNFAIGYGGGMNNSTANPMMVDCIFEDNSAHERGGGMFNREYSNTVLTNCRFIGNQSGSGGGMYNDFRSDSMLLNCVFSGNSSELGGGGMVNDEWAEVVLTNCLFSGNLSAVSLGGGMHNDDGSHTMLTNCTFSSNSAGSRGGAISCDSSCNLEMSNSILWGNTAESEPQISHDGCSRTVIYSDVQGGFSGEGNIDADPCFAAAGYWEVGGVWVQGDYHLPEDSACINSGDPDYIAGPNETDLDGNPRVVDGRIDMGVYELQPRRIIYVDACATGNNDGSSWADAYNCLQDALAAVFFGGEIRAAQGIYKPDEGGGNMSGDREATFQLINGVTIKGGYAGVGASDFVAVDPNMRDIEMFPTILSGDLAGDDGPDFTNMGENSRHVVTGNGTMTAILDGFTITSGYADGIDGEYPFINNGAGMYNEYANPTVINCTFAGNVAVLHDYEYGGEGAGMYNKQSNPTVDNCAFVGNSTDGEGGGIFNYLSSPTISNSIFRDNEDGGITFSSESHGTVSNCTFIDNVGGYGGGVNCEYSSPVINNCVFIGNSATYDGGGLRCYQHCYPTVTNCMFIGNTAVIQHGGAICNLASSPTVSNCTFTGNSAGREGGGIFCYRESNPNVMNCILWDNSAPQGSQIALWYYGSGVAPSITVSYSDVEGGAAAVHVDANCTLNWEAGNIAVDPYFVEPGYWDANGTPDDAGDDFWVEGDYRLSAGSPCVDAGDNDSVPPDTYDLDGDGDTAEPIPFDLDGNARIYDGDNDGEPVVDMGAYELGLVPMPIEVPMKLVPQALNPDSHGNWVKAFFVLPEGFEVEDVDTSRPAEIEQFQLTSEYMEVFVNEEGLVGVVAVFDRSAFCSIGPLEGEIAVVGYLTSGRSFRGTDTIKIVINKLKHLSILASHWLSVCSSPDWCDGADLDQDSVVNFVDIALLDGCCFEVIED